MLSTKYYSEYYGHPINDLDYLVNNLFKNKSKIYIIGDSTMDNKHWLKSKSCESVNGYEKVLKSMVPDINFYINYYLNQFEIPYVSINAAVEESCIIEKSKLNDHDKFVSKNIKDEDILIVSIGGNDVGTKLDTSMMINLVTSLFMYDPETIEKNPQKIIPEILKRFQINLKKYIKDIIGQVKPKLIIICGFFFPCFHEQDSWANNMLNLIDYKKNYNKIHSVTKSIYEHGIKSIEFDDIEIKTIPLYEVLDFKDKNDYVARVSASDEGGFKIGRELIRIIFLELNKN